MPARNGSRSLYAEGRSVRPSVSSLEGLRNALHPDNQPQKNDQLDQLQLDQVDQRPTLADDKNTMVGLNNRLKGYIDKVQKLRTDNDKLKEEIKDIIDKRNQTTGRDWDELEKPLDDLRKKIEDMTMDNARLLMEIDNNRMANNELKNKLATEQLACQNVEDDLSEVRKLIDDNQLARFDLESQLESAKEELAYLKKEHRDDVADLQKKIKESDVKVQPDSSQSNLSDAINKIRKQYEKIAKKNQEETNEWYRNKFENIKEEVSKNTESLESSMTELKDIRKEKKTREMEADALRNMIKSLEDRLKNMKGRSGGEIQRLNSILQKLQEELSQLRESLRQQAQDYETLLTTKMELDKEISQYQALLHDMTQSAELNHDPAQKDGKTDARATPP
ncbi:keratin, type I cytoskeletal 18-like [Brachyhypopomus gauderio]|uniref:keratin, type I cytoskeletal 18-like n=1 Tax=Brachyhypopomus gauderio TaxID=698409 RepID=UPI0040424EE6